MRTTIVRTGFHEVAVKRMRFVGEDLCYDQLVLGPVAFDQTVPRAASPVVECVCGLDPAVHKDRRPDRRGPPSEPGTKNVLDLRELVDPAVYKDRRPTRPAFRARNKEMFSIFEDVLIQRSTRTGDRPGPPSEPGTKKCYRSSRRC